MRKLLLTALTFTVLLLIPSSSHAQADTAQVSGTVAYRERMALPQDAVIDVQLLDSSVADVAAQTVAEVLITAEGRQVPVPFTLTYDPVKLDPAHRYSVRATIRSGDGMLMFSSTQAYPVLTHGAPSKVYLLLHTVGHGAKSGVAAKKQMPPTASEGAASSSEPKPPASELADVAPPTAPSTESAPGEATSRPQETSKQSETAAPPSATATEPPATPPSESASASTAPTEAAAPGSSQAASGSSAPATPPESAQSAQETAAPIPQTTEQQPPSSEPTPTTATPEIPTAQQHPDAGPPASTPESKPAEAAPAAAEQLTPPESKSESTTPASEAKPTEPEAPLPEAPSASKHLEAMPSTAEGNTPDGESSSRPERLTPNKAATPLADTNWRLIQLEGQDVVIRPPQKPVTISFSPEGRRIGGLTGCNSYLGTFNDDHGRIDLHPGNMTLMMCEDPAGTRERKFVAMLRAADSYKIEGDVLLLTSNGKIVAKFKNNQ